MAAYGHKRPCKSEVEVVERQTFDTHTHGIITRDGKIKNVAAPMLLITDAAGNVVASKTFSGDLTISGTITATKIVGAVYA